MYAKIVNNEVVKFPYNTQDLRNDNPNTSFPQNPTDELFAKYGVVNVVEAQTPNIDNKTHRHVNFVQNIDGQWTQVWEVQRLSKSAAEENVRGYRDQKLAECDWVVIKSLETGVNVPADWVSYRQALRDISAQPNFPFDIIWPVKP